MGRYRIYEIRNPHFWAESENVAAKVGIYPQ